MTPPARPNPSPPRSSHVELAPRHKQGLTLASPVMLAAGVVGYGDALPPGLELTRIGAYVTAPVTRRPWQGQPPRVVEVPGGVLWQRGLWNPGVRSVIRDFAGWWRRGPAPVIVHLGGHEPGDLAAVASILEQTPGVAGLEVDMPPAATPEDEDPIDLAVTLVRVVREAADLPLLLRLPLHAGDEAVQAVLDAGVDALVLAQPPAGLVFDAASGTTTRGGLHGPGLAPQIAARLAELAGWTGAPLVACGGVHSVQDALTYLAVGAVAVQLDTAIWVDPGLPARIAAALSGGTPG